MKRFFDYFKVPFIILAIVAVVCIGIKIANSGPEEEILFSNQETLISNNVFNYSNALTETQVAELEKIIANVEKEIHIDIAVITLNETLEGKYSSTPSKWVMEYADDFADNNKMGYDKAYGDSIVFVDNLFREPSTGKVYSWISTSGRAMNLLSQSDCENIMDVALANLTDDSNSDDYFYAYSYLVSKLESYCSSSNQLAMVARNTNPGYIVIFALIVAGIYILVNWKSKLGVRTTTSTTYVQNGRPNITNRQDIFVRKSVTKHKRETSSSSSGGHTSSGGFSHGGGGHSR